jgi:hypothetical protein
VGQEKPPLISNYLRKSLLLSDIVHFLLRTKKFASRITFASKESASGVPCGTGEAASDFQLSA